jgi:hypothetical protein
MIAVCLCTRKCYSFQTILSIETFGTPGATFEQVNQSNKGIIAKGRPRFVVNLQELKRKGAARTAHAILNEKVSLPAPVQCMSFSYAVLRRSFCFGRHIHVKVKAADALFVSH